MMRVLMLSHYFYPHVGGVEKHVEEISKRLIKRGYKVTIITEKFNSNLENYEQYKKINIYRIQYPKIKYLGLLHIWVKILLSIREFIKADIVQVHDIFIWYLPIAILFPRKAVYTTFHGWEGLYPIPIKNIVFNKIASFFSKKVLCAGKFIEKYYGIKADYIYYTAIKKPKSNNFRKEKNSILYVGRLDEDTGLRKILSALSCLDKKYHIEFCGDGLLAKDCKKIGIFHGFVNPERFYKKASVCVSAGLTSILEAMSYKCRIITTYNNPLKKDYLMMTPFKNWIDVEKEAVDMQRAIKRYFKDTNSYRKDIDQGYNWVMTQTWDNLADEYILLWEEK